MNALFTELYSTVLPVILQLIAAALMAFLVWVSDAARKRWNIEIEARHREALHKALMSGIGAALSKGLVGQAAIKFSIRHARKSTPDAIAGIKQASPAVLASIAEDKLRDAISIRETGTPSA